MNITDIVMNAAEMADEPAMDCAEPKTAFPKQTPIAMLYVPYQSWRKIYEPAVGLERGTIFEELDKPFIGERTI